MILGACQGSGHSGTQESGATDLLSAADTQEVDITEGRAAWQKPRLVIDRLGDLSELVVADIGAGTGYFSFRLTFKAKKVIALDVDQEMIDIMDELAKNLPEEQKPKFETRLAAYQDSNLEAEEVDLIIIVNTIAFIENRVEYLSKLKSKLKDDGRVMILDFKMKKIDKINAPEISERVPLYQLEEELLTAGFKNVESDDQLLEYQYMVFGSK